MLIGLCACAIYKTDNIRQKFLGVNGVRSIENLKANMEVQTASLKANISYFLFNYPHRFSVTTCKSGEDVSAIALGLLNKSHEKRVYDIYVGNLDAKKESFEFHGIIKDVDVDLSIVEVHY